MLENPQRSVEAAPEQLLYAKILEMGMYFGLGILLITFLVYVLGILSPYIPPEHVPKYWHLSVSDYLHQLKIEAGWAWLGMLKHGDFLNFVGIAILAAVTIVSYLAIVPLLVKNDDKIYAVLAVVEALILILAASGLLNSGGH